MHRKFESIKHALFRDFKRNQSHKDARVACECAGEFVCNVYSNDRVYVSQKLYANITHDRHNTCMGEMLNVRIAYAGRSRFSVHRFQCAYV